MFLKILSRIIKKTDLSKGVRIKTDNMNKFLPYRIKSYLNRFLMNQIAAKLPFSSVRNKFYKMAGLKIGKDVRINSNVFFSTSNIEIGQGAFVNRFCQVHDGLMGGEVIHR